MQIFPLKTKEEKNNIVFCIKVTHNLCFMLTQHYGVHKPRKKNVTETEKPNWQENKKKTSVAFVNLELNPWRFMSFRIRRLTGGRARKTPFPHKYLLYEITRPQFSLVLHTGWKQVITAK